MRRDALFSPDELLNVFADFYFQERLAVLRIVTILACVRSDPEELRYGIADVALSSIAPDPTSLVEALLAQIEVDSGPNPPSFAKTASKRSSKYAKQVLREQICQLELSLLAALDMAPGDSAACSLRNQDCLQYQPRGEATSRQFPPRRRRRTTSTAL
jgi:hypothetical protein